MDAMKILGSILASGMLGRGSSGGNVLASVLGSVLGGNQGGGRESVSKPVNRVRLASPLEFSV